VLYEKTAMTVQYCEQLQKFTSMNVGLNLYPVGSQEEVAKFLIQMVNFSDCNGTIFKKNLVGCIVGIWVNKELSIKLSP
jgi:hypothetical protein